MIFKNIIIMQIRKAISKRMDIDIEKLVYASLDIDFINGQSFLKDEKDNIITHSNVDILGEYTDLLIGRLEKNIKFDSFKPIDFICFENSFKKFKSENGSCEILKTKYNLFDLANSIDLSETTFIKFTLYLISSSVLYNVSSIK